MANDLPRGLRRAALALEQLEDRVTPSLLGNPLFPADNPWNQKITNAPVAANSAAVMNNLIASYGDGRLHPDVSQDFGTPGVQLYGIPYNVVHGNGVAKVNFVIDAYPGESDLLPVPVPNNVVIEGDYMSGPNPNRGYADGARGDSHLVVYDVDNNVAYEFFNASRPTENADGRWHADGEAVWDMKADSFRTLGWTSADAAGLSLLAGLARPDEGLPVSQGGQGVINHAIRVTMENSIILNQFLYPASHVANPGNTNAAVQPPMGARFRLKAGVDISQLSPESRIVAQAMKDYGLIIADNGANFFFTGAAYSVDTANNRTLTWDDNDIQDTVHGLKSLHFSDFELVDLTPTVSSLSASSGPPGSTLTVTGSNFSGAAGHLQVLFGSTPATSVTVLDDNHLTAVVPAAATGTVDVRVQSGVNAAGHPENIENPIFGYGTSAVNPADRFTVGSPPTVTITPVSPSPRNTSVGSMTITFNKAVSGFSLANLQLKTGGSGNLLTASQTLTTTDHITWVLGNLAGLTDPTRRLVTFTLTLSPAGVTDAAGNGLASGASSSFTVLDPALPLQGQTLTFTGTPGNDAFVFKGGGTAQVTLNGVSYFVDPTVASTINFVGNGGSDTATLTATPGGGSTLGLVPGGGTLSGPGYRTNLTGFGQVVAVGGAGDRAYLSGPAGNDVFVGTPAYAYLSGPGSWQQANGFGVVLGTAGAGSGTAYLYDSAGNDAFVATSAYAYLYGSGFWNQANGFQTVVGNASAGYDQAYLYGAAAGGNVFVGTPAYSYLYGVGFWEQASGFKVVVGNAAGANNAAYLYDSAGSDAFVATAAYSYLYGAGFFNQANGFATVIGYSTGGADQAYLLGSGTSADAFIDGGFYAYLYGNAFSALASNFGYVYSSPAARR